VARLAVDANGLFINWFSYLPLILILSSGVISPLEVMRQRFFHAHVKR
jgi:hypothetical protein